MGVKLLNTLFKNLNTGGINLIGLQQLQKKRIVVDASIYMFRFAATDNLLGNFYLLCATLRHYDIHSLEFHPFLRGNFNDLGGHLLKFHSIRRQQEQ